MTGDDNQLLHIIELPSDGIIIVTPVSYLMDALKETNIKVIDLCAYYANVKNGNTNLPTSAIQGILTELVVYPRMCIVCKFCRTDIDEDNSHYDTFHPHCFCGPNRYASPKDLEFHFKNQQMRHSNCLEPGCGLTFHTVYDLSTHHLAHQNAEPREKNHMQLF